MMDARPPRIHYSLGVPASSDRRSVQRWAIIATAMFAMLVGVEFASETDQIRPIDAIFDALALLLTVGAAASVAVIAIRLDARGRDIRRLVSAHLATVADRERWRARAETHLKGLSAALDEEFRAWTLTPAEMDIGRLLLKGLSHKQIADLRNTSEQTVRQQAQAIYQKSGLRGKAEFSAYFLDALFAEYAPREPLN
jgi:DNA-binding NarL/FixJ family response regulator